MVNNNDNNSYSHILKYIGLFGSVQGLSIAFNLLRNKLVALLLGPAGMGLSSLFNSSLTFVSNATNLGISFSAVKHLSETFDQGDKATIKHYITIIRCWETVTALIGTLAFAIAGTFFGDILFDCKDHAQDFLLLSPIVAMMAFTGGEMAILKGLRRLKALAVIQIWTIGLALVISVPIYWMFGMSGIVPVLLLCAFANMLLTMLFSFRQYPFRLGRFSLGLLREGSAMVKLGFTFIMTGVLGSGAEMVVRYFLNISGDLDAVGLYNAGYALTITYAGMVFSAMETDYFPRLSSINHDNNQVTQLANRQIEVTLLLISPLLAALIMTLPILLPLLYSGRFTPIVSMAQVAVFSMYFKAITLPAQYIPLAKGDSWGFFTLESVYSVVFVLSGIIGFHYWGLFGTGIALVVAHLADLVVTLIYTHYKYSFKLTRSVLRFILVLYPLGMVTYAATYLASTWTYWTIGLLPVAISGAFSFYILGYKKTSLLQNLRRRK